MELTPAPPQPLLLETEQLAQQLPSPRESPKPTDKSPENLISNDGQADKPGLYDDYNPTNESLDASDSLTHLMAPIQEVLRMETSLEPSLFMGDDENAMEESQAAENNVEDAMDLNTEDSHGIKDHHIVENGYAMEGDNAMEEEHQMLHLSEAEIDNEEDTLPSLDDIFNQTLSKSPTPEELGGGGMDIADEDEGSDFEDDSNVSSENDSEYETPRPNRNSAAEKKSKKPRRKMALTAREYVARLHEKEDEEIARRMKQEEEGKKSGAKRSRKRKLVGSDMGPSKTLKTANGNSFPISNDYSTFSKDDSLLPAESINAKTHADQIAQIMASIPQNCDTRRKTTQKQDLLEAKSLFGYKKVEAQDGNWKLKGMQTPMRSHQITAAAWMVKRELARMEPFGGILADAMGMGKTIMSLACIIGNPADDEHIAKFCKATLVVVPSKTIALQWEAEARVRILKQTCI